MKESIAALSSDKRIQLVLIAFCFGAFLEGTGGGGAPVAIAGSFLIGLGFEPFQAATLCLLANTAPVAWGAVGNPIRVLHGVTGLQEAALSAMTGRILPPCRRSCRSGWCGAWSAGVRHLRSGRLWRSAGCRSRWCSSTGRISRNRAWSTCWPRSCRCVVMVAFLKVWRPAAVLAHDRAAGSDVSHEAVHSFGAVIKGWSPFLLASVLIFLAAQPLVAGHMNFPALKLPMPWLHRAVFRVPPVVTEPTPEDAHCRPEPAVASRHGGLCAAGRSRHSGWAFRRGGSPASSSGRLCG